MSVQPQHRAPQHERRRRRSHEASRALQHQLDAIHARQEFDLLLIADSDGLEVASCGTNAASEALAAYAPLLSRTPHGPARRKILSTLAGWVPGATADGVHVREMEAGEERFHICAVGIRTSRTDATLHRIASALRRIFVETR